MSFAALVGGLDGERPAGRLGGIRQAPLRPPHPGEVVVGQGGLGRAAQDDKGLRPSQERRVVVGLQGEGSVERVQRVLRIAQAELDGAEGGPRHGPVRGDRDRLAIGDGGVLETPPQDGHVAGSKGLLVPLEEGLGHRRRLPDREENGRPVRGARLVSASCTAAPCAPA